LSVQKLNHAIQWDGFKHFAHQPSKCFYNGLTSDEINSGKAEADGDNGIDNWVKGGGIAGRGVLLDYVRWREKTGQPALSPVERYGITLDELEAVASYQGVSFKPADILIIRSGFVKWHDSATSSERQQANVDGTFIGVQATQSAVEWIWNHHFAAVAGDTIAFEAWPPPLEGKSLHENLLSLMGTPIGELFNLEELSKGCEQENKWTFLLTSAPLNMPGSVASPPNAIAIL